jgi:hypothetical protein
VTDAIRNNAQSIAEGEYISHSGGETPVPDP